MADNLSQLLATPLQPQREQWYSAAQAELLRTARARHEISPDAYWTWVAEQQRWIQPRDIVRTGELGDFSYFGGGRMNVADNCVDRWAEDPAAADRTAVIWEGEPGDVRTGGGVPLQAKEISETGSTWAYSVAGVEALKPGSTGTVVPGHVYDILDDNGKPVPPGTKGNLVLTQPFPALARMVWDDPDRYQHAYFTRFPGCYCTNDEAVLDADGHLWVLGRADDVINVAAHRISTLEIEAIATSHPQVAEAAVVGVSDATKGTVPVAFLTLLDGADPGRVRQDVSAEVASQLGGYARLGAVYLTTALPKTRTGKIMRRLLRDVVEHGGPQGDTSAMEDLAGLQAVQQAVAAEAAPTA